MVFTESTTAFTEREKTDLCKALIEILEKADNLAPIDAGICTFFMNGPNQDFEAVPYSRFRSDSDAMRGIRTSKQTKPVSDKMNKKNERPVAVESGSFEAYFSNYRDNSITDFEAQFAQENNYDKAKAWYFAIPFPSGMNAQGVFFPFIQSARHYDALSLKISQICEDMKNYFDK